MGTLLHAQHKQHSQGTKPGECKPVSRVHVCLEQMGGHTRDLPEFANHHEKAIHTFIVGLDARLGASIYARARAIVNRTDFDGPVRLQL